MVLLAHDLIVWTQAVLEGEFATAEAKRLGYRLLHVAGRLAFTDARAKPSPRFPTASPRTQLGRLTTALRDRTHPNEPTTPRSVTPAELPHDPGLERQCELRPRLQRTRARATCPTKPARRPSRWSARSPHARF